MTLLLSITTDAADIRPQLKHERITQKAHDILSFSISSKLNLNWVEKKPLANSFTALHI